jgi:hypothetical protein
MARLDDTGLQMNTETSIVSDKQRGSELVSELAYNKVARTAKNGVFGHVK